MKITYNDVGLHDLGEISLGQRREFEGGENPYRVVVTLTVTLRFWERTFADNYDLVRQARQALDVQHAVLRWEDTDTGSVWVDTPAVVSGMDWPDDPNGWGTYEQMATVTFQYVESTVNNQSRELVCDFGTAGTVRLTRVTAWKEQVQTERFDPLRSNRRTAMVRVTAAGVALSQGAMTVQRRREMLDELKRDWREKMVRGKEATLSLGEFSKVVRVESFEVSADEAGHVLNWSLAAVYTAHPNEAQYAIAEWSYGERNGLDLGACGNGEQGYSLSGKVQAHSDAAAKTRINEIRNAVVDKTLQIVDTETEARTVSGADGESFLERTFRMTLRGWRVDNVVLVFEKSDGGAPVELGNMTGYSQRYSASRFNEHRSHRRSAAGQIVARGTLFTGVQDGGGVSQREALLALQQGILAQVNGADGTLSYGSLWTKVVRVEEFSAEINQAVSGIEWTLTASFSEFPNEENYATVEFSAQTRENEEEGDALLSFSGRVAATSKAAALAKLEVVRATVLEQYGYTLAQRLSAQTSDDYIQANGDATAGLDELAGGTSFVEMSFTEEYRKRMSDVLTYTLRVATSDEVRAGFVTTTYSGTVTASGASVDAAYAAASAKAQALGGGKHPVLLRSSLSFDQRLSVTSGAPEFVRLEFSYEYQTKGAQTYYELSSSVAVQAFDNDRESIAGFVVAPDSAAAQATWATLRSAYDRRLVLSQETQESVQSTGGVQQFVRLDFRMEVFRAKAAGTVVFRYEIDTAKDWMAGTQTITVQGTCVAPDRGAALAAVEGFVRSLGLAGLQGREPSRSQRTESYGKESSGTTFFQVAFSEVYIVELVGTPGILECSVTEEVQYSGTRWVVQDLPRDAAGGGGISVVQDCGVESGRRTVRGSVTAATLATALDWAKGQRSLLTGDLDENSYPLPETITTDYEFAARVSGVLSGATANVKLFRVGFSFGEILPNYPAN